LVWRCSSSGKLGVAQNEPLASLGHLLFFDSNLSSSKTKSCASCHAPQLAFTDGYRRSFGAYADMHKHNTPSLLNLNTYSSFNWASPEIHTLEHQISSPLFGKDPIEMGWNENDTVALQEIFKLEQYQKFLKKLNFQKPTWSLVKISLSAYIEKLESRNSKYDQVLTGKSQEEKFTPEEQLGFELFNSSKFHCIECHGGKDFNRNKLNENFHLTDGNKIPIRTPSLRNVAITSPYMHDGGVMELPKTFPHVINGSKVDINEKEKFALISFLYTLTDTSYLKKSYFSPPNYLN
jgi:cytochrome c peroxidase